MQAKRLTRMESGICVFGFQVHCDRNQGPYERDVGDYSYVLSRRGSHGSDCDSVMGDDAIDLAFHSRIEEHRVLGSRTAMCFAVRPAFIRIKER